MKQLPVEILNTILLHAEAAFTRAEFVALRLVNTHFNNRVLSLLFSELGTKATRARFMSSKTYPHAPATLQTKYLKFRLRRHGLGSNLFAYLFLPVFERRVEDLGLKEVDEEKKKKKNEVLEELLGLVQFDTETAWVVGHRMALFESSARKAGLRKERGNQKSGDAQCDLELIQLKRKQQIEQDYWYACTAIAILRHDEDAVSRLLLGKWADPLRLSFCFGSTIALVAARHGSIATVRTTLGRVFQSKASRRTMLKIFVALSERPVDAMDAAELLIGRIIRHSRPDPKQVELQQYWFVKSCLKGHPAGVKAFIDLSKRDWNTADLSAQFHAQMTIDEVEQTAGDEALFQEGFEIGFSECHWDVVKVVCPHIRLGEKHENLISQSMLYSWRRSTKPPADILQVLLANGLEVPKGIENGWAYRALASAVCNHWPEWVDGLLQAGVDLRHYAGHSPILRHSMQGSEYAENTILLLIKHGWDVENLEVENPRPVVSKDRLPIDSASPSIVRELSPRDYML